MRIFWRSTQCYFYDIVSIFLTNLNLHRSKLKLECNFYLSQSIRKFVSPGWPQAVNWMRIGSTYFPIIVWIQFLPRRVIVLSPMMITPYESIWFNSRNLPWLITRGPAHNVILLHLSLFCISKLVHGSWKGLTLTKQI